MPSQSTRRWAIWGLALGAVLAVAYVAQVDLWVGGFWHGLPPGSSASSAGLSASTRAGSTAPASSQAAAVSRPANWARPIAVKSAGNFFQVADNLYRGEQPTTEGFASIKAMGIRTIVNLRVLHSDKKLMGDASFNYVEIEFDPIHAETEDIVEFLKIAADPAQQPVFVHCQHGSDRTGTMIAAYRIAVQGWTNEEALDEMVNGGYGFHEQWINLAQFVRRLDAKALRRQAGLDK